MASLLMGRLSACSRAPVARHCGSRAAVGGAAVAMHRRRGFAEMPTPPPGYRAKLACLDLEGVLIPEVWVNLAERVGVEELKRTTRDEPVYEKLMRYRLDIMKREGLTIHDIHAAIDAMEPFPGAPEFVEVRAPPSPSRAPAVATLLVRAASVGYSRAALAWRSATRCASDLPPRKLTCAALLRSGFGSGTRSSFSRIRKRARARAHRACRPALAHAVVPVLVRLDARAVSMSLECRS